MIRYSRWVTVLILGLMVFATRIAAQITFKQLTTDPSIDRYPLWRTDGSRILFSSNRNSSVANGNDIWDMNPDGSDQRALVEVVVSTPPAWGDSGLGTPKAFIGATGDLIVLETQDFWEVMRVALSTATTFPIVRTVWNGNDMYFTDLLNVPGGQNVTAFALSPNTQTLAWAGYVGGPSQLRTAPFSTLTGQPSNTAGTAILQGSENSQGLAYSPDGTQLVVSLCLGSCISGGNDLYIINASTGAIITPLTSNGGVGLNNTEPTWSPTGQWIAFTSNSAGNNGIWMIRPDGTGLTQITTDQNSNFGSGWSPNGTMLAFTKQDATTGNYDIWLASNVVSSCSTPVRPVPDTVLLGFGQVVGWATEPHNGTDYESALSNAIISVGPGGVIEPPGYTKNDASRFGAISKDPKLDGKGPAIWVKYKLATGAPIYVLYGHTADCPAPPCWNDESTGSGASFHFNCTYTMDWQTKNPISAATIAGFTAPYYLNGKHDEHLHISVFVPNKSCANGTAYCQPPRQGWGYSQPTFPSGEYIDPETFFGNPQYCLVP